MDNSNEQIKLMGSAIEDIQNFLDKGISDENLSESIKNACRTSKDQNASVQEKYLDQQSMLWVYLIQPNQKL